MNESSSALVRRAGISVPGSLDPEVPAIVARGTRHPRRVEWPTVAVAGAIYAAFGAVTWYHAVLPWWALLGLGAAIVAWHGSLQHEVIHGHPTSCAWFNHALVFPCLWLWMPMAIYRKTHLAHHRDAHLTHPELDPESFYLTPRAWFGLSRIARRLRLLSSCLLGRLLLGPALAMGSLLRTELHCLAAGDAGHWRSWGAHVASCTLVLGWVWGVCGMSPIAYFLLIAYPALSLTLLRSFAEHRAHAQVGARIAVVEAGPLLSLLYLNNNLHVVHHAVPGAPWYELPVLWRADRARWLEGNRGFWYPGYGALARTYLLRAKEPVVHPLVVESSDGGWMMPVGRLDPPGERGLDGIASGAGLQVASRLALSLVHETVDNCAGDARFTARELVASSRSA